MKIITMYELLGMIKDGKELPKKIRYKGNYWYLEQKFSNRLPYYSNGYNDDNLLTGEEEDYFSHSLNDEVEIIEEKKIPEKLEYEIDENGEFSINGFTFDFEQKMQIIDTVNQIIDCINSKGDE